ncbi:hypothetical protein PF007_g25632 [Phytophthora fragariae]|uniref:Uncharacterized protein n=1 Tax=Phytophthora fragariae TaxID=53985 RepID=A0A6A3H905_9STRA|nr:hypothetical protein PF009_g26326 [Phytophthora fragariae]KAE8965700.1 hypothetical protein PF011_g28193 [Phytophthora fragariae]KAE9073887.1 hypothetical protein PF007_g25632 [Phytophthora fragariae]
MRRFWWMAVAPLAVWVVHEVVFVKLDVWIKSTGFEFR